MKLNKKFLEKHRHRSDSKDDRRERKKESKKNRSPSSKETP